MFGSGPANEALASREGKGDHDSPDGVLFNCSFDNARLKGNALAVATVYVGREIAQIRDPQATGNGLDFADVEYNGMQTAALYAVASGLKTLTMPGAYLVWNLAWVPADRDQNMDEALTRYVATLSSAGQ